MTLRPITHPLARPDGVVFADQDVAVELPDGTPEPVIASWLAAGDVRVLSPRPELFSADPRVGPGSARLTITLSRPLLAPADLPEVAARIHALGGSAQLAADGEVVGREHATLEAGRARHEASVAELPRSAHQLSQGQPAVETIFLTETP